MGVSSKSLYGSDPGFNGSINEFDIYNNALSASSVTTLFNAGPSTAVPEPATLGMLAIGGLGLLLTGRRKKAC